MSTSKFVSTADTISGLGTPAMGDERESDIVLRGTAFAYMLSTLAALIVPIGLALTGSGMWSLLALIALMSPSFGLALYCRSEGISMEALAARASRRRKTTIWTTYAVLTIAYMAALSFHASTGHPLVDIGSGFEKGSADTDFGFPGGLIAGGLVGGACAIYSLRRGRRLAEQREREQRLLDE